MEFSKGANIDEELSRLGIPEPPKLDRSDAGTARQNNGPTGADSVQGVPPQPWSWRFNGADFKITETCLDEAPRGFRHVSGRIQNPSSFDGCSSDAGASSCSFISIVPVRDMGHSAHIEWESYSNQNESGTSPSKSLSSQPQATTDAYVDVQSVSNAIFAASQTSALEDRSFLPLDALRQLVTPSVVRRLMGHAFVDTEPVILNSWATDISGEQNPMTAGYQPKRRKLFAILILMEQVQLIKDFIENGIDDRILPLKIKREADQEPVIQLQTENGLILHCLDHWHSRHLSSFIQWQEIICTPFFQLAGHVVHYYELNSKTILPFKTYKLVRVGGYGSVRKVSIHPAHYNNGTVSKDQEKDSRHFAIKQLHSECQDEYEREVELFERLGAQSNEHGPDHLIQLQLTYKHGQSYYLVFPWADGNLCEFWERRTADPSNHIETVWLLEQLLGLVRALRKIHHLRTMSNSDTLPPVSDRPRMLFDDKHWGRHGDIKPENILWFQEYKECHRDFLVISDFGLTRFNSADSRSKVAHDSVMGFSGSYRPPDIDLKGNISQRYDIWSLGCVFLEFVSWFLVGNFRTRKEFSDTRIEEDRIHTGSILGEDQFFNLNSCQNTTCPTADVKASVLRWIDVLHKQDNCAEPLHELLDLVQFTMLVPDSKERWVCSRIQPVIKDLLQRSKNNAYYATMGTSGVSDPSKFPPQSPASPFVRRGLRHSYLLANVTYREVKAQF
ncbi:kinase-like domain-containing protein [Colletotrichum godetiae]|uniref:Kinase-like domain-containing protein n=1 Tax=Colletotrichum godetiae TaxID=1209918 RepID=A0AAJ0F4P0_9PEZI|nr:kinase-like domain-containing protein [Colletotrichum godetiae]KAK1700650.1 kinase-like domain-containing protein [Colletotrichum godetiae]